MTKWDEFELVEYSSQDIAAKFIYENIITSFGYPLTLINDQRTHFVNKTIDI